MPIVYLFKLRIIINGHPTTNPSKEPPKLSKNPPISGKNKPVYTCPLFAELELFQTDSEHREQRHLFARILIYGHSNLLEQLRKFSKERQREIVRDLKMVDYETTDLVIFGIFSSSTRI